MDISPAIPTPRAGDPITAAWAAQIADAINSSANPPERDGAILSPFGRAELTPLAKTGGTAKMPMPFDCVVMRPQGASSDKLYIWLPDIASGEYVVFDGKPLGPAQGQSIGDSDSAWVEVGSVTNAATRFVYLTFHTDANDEVDGWEVEDTATAWNPQSGGTGAQNEPPKVLLASYNIAADAPVPSAGTDNKWPSGKHGLVQFRHGTIELGGGGEVRLDTDESPGNPPGESVNRYKASQSDPDDGAPLQLRQFHDTSDVEATQGIGETGSDTEPDALQVLFRKKAPGSTPSQRPKLVYVEALTGPFWVKGADAAQNWGESIKLGTPALGFITISVTQ